MSDKKEKDNSITYPTVEERIKMKMSKDMSDRKEEDKPFSYPSVEEKIKMKVEKEKTHYTKFENYLYKDKVLPNGLTVEEQQIENIKNRSWEKKFSIRKDIFRKFDEWLNKKAQEEIDRIEREDSSSITKMGNGKADFWMGFTGQRQSRYSMLSSAGAFVRGSLNFLEGIVEVPFMLVDPDEFMEELVNTPKAFGQMKEEIENGNLNMMGILTTEASWGVATAALGAAAKRNAAIERSNAQMTDDVAELAERMNKCSPDRSCFLAGTLVETKTGKKAIEEIEEGEEVWCEEDIGEQKLKKVLKRIEKTNDILYHVYIRNQEIHTTEDHAIWLEGEGWKKAEDIQVGDIVRCRTGEPEKITNIWMEKLPEQVKVYNLSVEDCHNYYVSEKGVLVHNDCPKNNKVNIESGNQTKEVLGGRFKDVDAAKRTDEVGHHMPQNAFMKKELGVPRDNGPALLMSQKDHELTRTFKWKGAMTMKTDAGLNARQRMLLDIIDIKKNFGRKYNKGMLEAIRYAKTLPEFTKKR